MARHAREPGIDQQARAVLHKRMADKPELGLHPGALAIEHGVGIGGAGVRGVGALLGPEVDGRVTPAIIVAARPVELGPA